MKTRFAGAAALAFAMAQLAAMPAYAEAPFRTAAPHAFSTQELTEYGLNSDQVSRAEQLQSQGYEIKVLSEQEAAQYQAGFTDNQWLLIGILAGVIVIAVAVAD
jgi:hypothetical protein